MDTKLLSKCFYELYQAGLTTASGGNISCRQADGLICISPSQIDKGYLKADDFAFLNKDGAQVGNNKPSMEYPFHLSIYRKFSHIKTIVHIHPPVFVALSLLSENNPELKKMKGKLNLGYSNYAIPGSELLGINICEALKKEAEVVLMQNHGVIAIGENIDEVFNRIVELNNKLIDYFKLGSVLDEFSLIGKFNLIPDHSSGFYEKRAQHFLSTKNKVEFLKDEETGMFFCAVQLKSLEMVSQVNFSTHLIPESYLILKNPLLKDEKFDSSKMKNYLKSLNSQAKTIIFEDGWALISGTSPYSLYDKMEVLDFTAKVTLIAQKMGMLNLLSGYQIEELKEKFLC